jgi:hypothetical protein
MLETTLKLPRHLLALRRYRTSFLFLWKGVPYVAVFLCLFDRFLAESLLWMENRAWFSVRLWDEDNIGKDETARCK